MTIEEILALGDFEKIMKALSVRQKFDYNTETALAELEPAKHTIFDKTKRPDREAKKATSAKNPDGTPVKEVVTVPVARIAVPFQKVIVERVVGLFLGNPVKMKQILSSDMEYNNDADEILNKIFADNKMNFRNREIARSVFASMECAEYWYMVENQNALPNEPKFKLKIALFTPLKGDKLYPHFDDFGDMDAFSREYAVMEGDEAIECFDIYTANQILKGKKVSGKWETESIKNNITKIPIVYYRQSAPEWANVQIMIERYETLLSNYADTNDYFSSPMVLLKGDVHGFPDKGDVAKTIRLKGENASAEYLTWDQAPDAVKLELETLRYLIFSLSMTHDIGTDVAKGLGSPSTQSLKFMFLDPINKVRTKEEIFGEGFQRRANVIKEFVKVIDTASYKLFEGIEFQPVFKPAIPENESEEIETLATAVQARIMSTTTAVKRNPFVDNTDEELKLIEKDRMQDMADAFAMQPQATN